ncbi:hypothetical protein LWI29_007126 [Acer saccharum]|uniref:Putative plant transposon protein domain-containing protein n=1 Tax=Acer saccharum TaxID=4024 RepID=A0AA39RC45_ACESA|nr:hypothetical protein LWI29_007126 [Acer saccharum]
MENLGKSFHVMENLSMSCNLGIWEDHGISFHVMENLGKSFHVMECRVMNPDFPSNLAKWAKRQIIPEKGIKVSELSSTPIPETVERRGWQTYVQHPPRYYRQIVEEFYAGMIPRNYLLGDAVWIRGREVRINPSNINRYIRTTLTEEERENMSKGLTRNEIFIKMNVELANALTDQPLRYWHTRASPLRQSKIFLELAFWHVFISYSPRPCKHRTHVAYEVAQLLYCILHNQPLDVGVLIKMEIHKIGKDESKKEWMGFPSLITHFCMEAGIDLSGGVMTEPPEDMGINRWYALFPSRGLDRPGGRKRARRDRAVSESEDSEPEGSEAEDEEPEQEARQGELLSEDDESRSRWFRLLSALKTNRRLKKNERVRARKRLAEQLKDFSKLRTELKLSQYSRQKKAHPIPTNRPHQMEDPISQEEKSQLRIAMERSLSEMRVGDAHSRRGGGPIISEEESQLRMAMERSLKEMRDKEAARSKGKDKVSGSS